MTRFPFKVVCVDDHAYIHVRDAEGNVLNPDERLRCSLTIGKTYEVIGEDHGMWRLVDDTNDDFLFPKSRFRLIDE